MLEADLLPRQSFISLISQVALLYYTQNSFYEAIPSTNGVCKEMRHILQTRGSFSLKRSEYVLASLIILKYK